VVRPGGTGWSKLSLPSPPGGTAVELAAPT